MATQSMEIYEARLASFQAPATTGRKRVSTTKGGKNGKWSLKNPSAEDLAQAGFYFAPTGTGSDNVTCFCCEKSLDGWEEGDNPFSEHLHFSGDCAWAIMMAIENKADQALLSEDPMSERLLEARKQTFRDQWPHEQKRGWTCKIQKMIQGGWYFSPSLEGEDQTNCAYCKKSLWGWEQKDKPYEEHKKRSPECPFFSASQAKTVAKGRKPRVSKTSRVSGQSNTTLTMDNSAAPSHVLDNAQSSMMTADTSVSSTTTKAKKAGRPKKATTQGMQSKAVDEETIDIGEHATVLPTRSTRGKKRTSDQMVEDFIDVIEPAPKKRATRTRAASASKNEPSSVVQDDTMDDAESVVVSKKGGKGGRKRASSTTRKVSKRIASAQSVASQVPVVIPEDDEIEAQLAADLERFESDDGSDNWKVLGTDDSIMSQVRALRTTRTSNIKTVSKITGKVNNSVIEDRSNDLVMEEASSPELIVAVKKPSTKALRKGKKASSIIEEPILSRDIDIKEFEESLEADDQEHLASVDNNNKQKAMANIKDASGLSVATLDVDSGHETDGSVLAQNKVERESKKSKGAAKAKQPEKKTATKVNNIKKKSVQAAFEAPIEVHDDDVDAELEALHAEMEGRAFQPAIDVALDLVEPPTPQIGSQNQPISPEASPQASDAENQPPSSRPSQTRPPLARYSPTGARTVRVALAPSTPTTSPSKRNACRLETSYPWAPADIDYILTGTPAGNRENIDPKKVLSTEEKKMTLEEWINWNAKVNEDKLKGECERMVGKFESEGVRALKTLEGIVCFD